MIRSPETSREVHALSCGLLWFCNPLLQYHRIYFHQPPYLHERKKKNTVSKSTKMQYSKERTNKRSIGLPRVPCQRPAPKRLLPPCTPRADIMQRLAARLYPQRAHPTPTHVSPHRVCSPAAHRPVEDPNPQQCEQADGEHGRGCGTSTFAGRCGSGYHCSQALLRVAAI